MASRKLAGYVTVAGQTFGPDDEVPADIAEQITNPKAWADQPGAEGEEAPAKKAAAKRSSSK